MISAIKILGTIIVIFLLVYGIIKKFDTPFVMFTLGVLSLIVVTFATGQSLGGGSGSAFLDVFETVKSKYASNLTGTCLLIMAINGYIKYLDQIGASKLLASYLAKPLQKFHAPYLLIVLMMVITEILKLCLPSASGLATLIIATLYPVCIAAGADKLICMAAINLAVSFDIGVACPITTMCVAMEPVAAVTNITEFFVKYQLWRTCVVIFVATVVFVIVGKAYEKKHPSEAEVVDIVDPKSLGLPWFFAILPFVPLILVCVFSQLTPFGIVLSVPAANFLGLAIAMLLKIIFVKGDKKAIFNEASAFWKGMGASMTAVVCLVCCAGVFSAGLDAIGGTKLMLEAVGNSALGGKMVVMIACVASFALVAVTGSSIAASSTLLPMIFPILQASGTSIPMAVFAMVSTGGLARAICPVCANTIVVANMSGYDVMTISKRTFVPTICAWATTLILTFVAL